MKMSNTAIQELLLTNGEIIFEVGSGPTKIRADLPRNFVNIISLDGSDGNPVAPGAGVYNTFVEAVPGSGFQSVADNGTLDATKTGGNSITDGTVLAASFVGPVNRIKVVQTGVTTATHAKITIQQGA